MVREIYPDYDNDKLDEIRYGLEATYLSITKLVVILGISLLLGIFKESVILLVLFNFLRLTGFGLHATKSWMCWVSSSITFLLVPFFCKSLVLPNYVLVAISVVCLINFLLYAPADTVKRPLIHKKRRLLYKVCTILIAFLYTVLIFITKDTFLQNSLSSAMLIEGALINPYIYKLFNLPYNNYKNYVISASK
jgi:probable accessory gene regulator protein